MKQQGLDQLDRLSFVSALGSDRYDHAVNRVDDQSLSDELGYLDGERRFRGCELRLD